MAVQKTTGVIERSPGSGIWWIRYTDAKGKRHWEKVGRRSDAITLLAKRKHEKLLRKKLPEALRGRAVTFGELAKKAMIYSEESHTPQHHHQFEIKLQIIGEQFNELPAEGITSEDIQAWLLEQSDERGWTPATRNRYRDAFSLVFRKAVENHVLTVNPATLVKAKPEHNERVRFLSAGEETKLTAALHRDWAPHVPAFLVSIHTGMRAGEQFQLKWRDVSLERRLISLPKTKSGKARHIPLNAVACSALQERKRAQQEHAAKQKEKGADHADQAYVFRDAGRDPQHNYRRWFNEALAEAKIKDYSWHCNRHTFASRLVMAGVDLRTVAELMGHSSIQMTMRYAHLAPQHNRAAVDRLVSLSDSRQTRKAPKRENELVTKSVTTQTRPTGSLRKNSDKTLNNSDLQDVAP
ncbi:MAG TPA: site-specific integrase [Acidobacteriaceae bacterium]|jgi:integrase|nr:site-specific integrase [Acidobacteriaceae bacterium]